MVILGSALGAGAVENDVVDTGMAIPADGGLESPDAEEPAPSESAPPSAPADDPAPFAPADVSQSGTHTPAARPSGADTPFAVEPLTPAAAQTGAAEPAGRSFRIVAPAQSAGDESPISLPTSEPFGIVLAAAVLLLMGASVGHAWAQATGRLDFAV